MGLFPDKQVKLAAFDLMFFIETGFDPCVEYLAEQVFEIGTGTCFEHPGEQFVRDGPSVVVIDLSMRLIEELCKQLVNNLEELREGRLRVDHVGHEVAETGFDPLRQELGLVL